MNETTSLITFIKELANVGIPTLIVGGVLYWLIWRFPDYQKLVDAGKKERAEIYASALKSLGDQIGNQSKQIEHFGSQVEKFGEQVSNQTNITKMLVETMNTLYETMKGIGARCIEHGSILAILKDRNGGKE